MARVDLQDLIGPVSKDLEAFNAKLTRSVKAESVMIRMIVKHIFASRGKRLRPIILFLTARSGGYGSAKMVDAALAIELIHTATLLHDDVVDESVIRRGRETVNHRWNNIVSVLMGDYLFSRAFSIMNKTGSRELIKAISQATERVSFGELRQIEETANFDLHEPAYIKIISDKTGSLFAISCEAGPIMKKATNGERKRFHDFGENVGIAFQIADDLLDFIGISSRTGKQSGSDLIQGKVTLPLIYSLSKSSKKVRSEITTLLDNGINRRSINRVLKFVTEQGGIDYAYAAAKSYSDRAAEIFEKLKDSTYSRSLRNVLQFTVSRDN